VIHWPVPEIYEDSTLGMITYVYHDETTLLVPLTISDSIPDGEYSVEADLSWLECEVACVPGSGSVSGFLKVQQGAVNRNAEPDWLIAARASLPDEPEFEVHGEWNEPDSEDEGSYTLWFTPGDLKSDGEWGFWPYPNENMEISTRVELLESGSKGAVGLKKTVFKFDGDWPDVVPGGLLTLIEAGAKRPTLAYAVNNISKPDSLSSVSNTRSIVSETGSMRSSVQIGNEDEGDSGSVQDTQQEQEPQQKTGFNLWWMLLQGFIGGVILNIMPCVLPVISLKILGFVEKSRNDPKSIRRMGWFFTSGVVFSFLILAGLVIGIQKAGALASWGMQFQNPQYLMVLTVVVTLVTLNLFGVFEVSLTSGTVGVMNDAASKKGGFGAFMNGILATALATPCSAPFLGVALGFAFTQPPIVTVVMFLSIGLGLAAPYLVLCFRPDWLQMLPKPGAWMERFKVALGFPMLGTTIWLFTVVSLHLSNEKLLWFGLFLSFLAMSAWVYGQFVQRGVGSKFFSMTAALILLMGGYAYAMEKEVNWRSVGKASEGSSTLDGSGAAGAQSSTIVSGGITWYPWSPEAVAAAREEGLVVFVDFTASWCWTCKVNKKTSIEIDSVRQKMNDLRVVAMRADNSKASPEIDEALREFDRAGVPLNLVYPADSSESPIVLPEILTPGIVLDALDQAAGEG
jgi:thiol:disulfide interchange protein DsbD